MAEYIFLISTVGLIRQSCGPAARFFTYGLQINWNILNCPALKSNVRIYRAREEQQLAAYRNTVLTALQEVENDLSAFSTKVSGKRTCLGGYSMQANRGPFHE